MVKCGVLFEVRPEFLNVNYTNMGFKLCRLSLKLSPPTIPSSLPFYPYQKDERALPEYLLTRCSFSPSDI
jgi:hypothetical protein